MDPVVAARVAKEAGVKKLVYVHITPPLTNKTTEELYLKGVSDIFNGEIILGGGSHEIQVKTKILEISFISYFENFFLKKLLHDNTNSVPNTTYWRNFPNFLINIFL